MADHRAALRAWVAARNDGLSPHDLADDTPLIEARYLTSLQVAELLLFLEERSGQPLDIARLRPGVFRDIDTICSTFLDGVRP